MRYTLLEQRKDALLLVARVLMMGLFMLFGWSKLNSYSGTVAYMASTGAPLPAVSAIIAIVMELVVGIALVFGFYTRPLALMLAVYTLAAAFIGHQFWNTSGAVHHNNLIHFYKNVCIFGGLLLLCVTGPGRYSIDRR